MKKSAKILALILSFMLIFSVVSVSMTAYAAASGDVVGQYDYKIQSTYKTVDWDTWKAYKAATHVHTVRSDGDIELNDMIEKYYELGFDALALTDHGTVNYGWTKDQDRLAIFGYQYFVHGNVDELSTSRYTEITTGTGVPSGAVAPRGYGMTEIPLGIELNGMSTSKCHINGFFVDAGHGELGTSETWPRSAVKTNYDAGGITHINHVGEWSDAKSDIGIYDANFISDFASIYQDYCPNREVYTGAVRGCIGMELVNTADSRTKYDRYLYDEIMKILAPQGINVFGFCEDDAHDYSDCDRNAQYFLMPSNDTQANNIKTAMTTGAFYASSKNSKGVYELGDGFSASGDYPSISNIETNDKTSQIRVTVKDADKARMVADGVIIETYDISTNENTVVFDLNNYEDQINSYVRIYFTGPGGITYLQSFLVTKAETEVSSVKFKVPSADTTVKVYDAAGSLVPPANTDRVYVLDPGDYTYIASRPGYLTTDPIPFTVTQSDIDNAVKREIDVTLEKDSEAVFTYFYVPETIYLNPSDMKTFDSYVDRANEEDGALNSSISKTGNIFFSRDGATDIKLSYEVVEGGSLSSMTVSNVSSASSTLSTTITAGSLSSALTSDSHALIKWTASYKYNSKTFTSYSYTYVYAPLTGTSSAAAAGGFAETAKNLSWLHTTMNITATVWLTGVHSVSGGSAAYKYAPYGGPAVVDTSGVNSITATGVGMGTASDSSNGGSKTVNPTGGQGNLTIDTSRYNNFNQIPLLSVGLDINSAVECDSTSSDTVQSVSFGDTVLYSVNTRADLLTGKRVFASDNTDASKDIDVPISTSQSSITITGQAAGYKSSRVDKVVGTVTLNLSYVNKTDLRQQYENAIKLAYQSDWFTDSTDYNNYIDSIKNAATVLGNPASSAAEIDAAKSSLTAALSDVELKTGVSTINYLDSQGNVIDSEQVEYKIGGTIVASVKDIEGYEYSNNWECIADGNEVKSGEETFGNLMAVQDAYTWNFYYEPISYTVSFASSDEEYSPIGG
ncbi:MAG: PHP domain-containing protein, partial [Acutalibacteraceae bacterium]